MDAESEAVGQDTSSELLLDQAFIAAAAVAALAACSTDGPTEPTAPPTSSASLAASTEVPPPAAISGIWDGTATLGAATLGLRFELTAEADALSGRALFREPRSGELVDVGSVAGSRHGSTARWDLEAGGSVAGVFHGNGHNEFKGDLVFVPQAGVAPLTAKVDLRR